MGDTQTLHATRVRDVHADLNYLAPTIERPRTYTYPAPDGQPQSTVRSTPHRVLIRDMRVLKEAPQVDREGFALLHTPTAVRDFYDDAEIRAVYYPEVERVLAAATGAARVVIFDHTVRRRTPGQNEDRQPGAPRQPVPRVHVDHTVKSGPQRVRNLLPDEAEELLRGRVQVINLWRPIVGPLRDAPLAVADARTVRDDDLVASDLIYPDRVGETYQVRYNPAHAWFYAPDMERDEALLLKCYDSRTDRARFAPHTAFTDPSADGTERPRESIEIRSFVFHPA
ncbi:MAG TPA: CmcJ/NvfI family oxidoreductase [Acetobacteraceae bacterium]|jgi:hypothetical protein|nr:CmcJ/NvfI family oxidoreductase [Acetobacteraceae bacterium]